MLLRPAAVGCHLVLGTALTASVLYPTVTPLRIVAAAVLTLSLLLTLRGLIHGQRIIEQRLSVLLVLYAGGACVEVVAQSGTALLVTVALLAAVLELGLTLVLIRRSPLRAPAARE